MNHVDQQIQAYCDDELSPAERTSFEAHLQSCPACRDRLEAVRQVWDRVDASSPSRLSRPLWPGIASRIGREGPAGGWTWPQRGLALAALVAGVVIGVGLGGPTTSDTLTGVGDATASNVDYLEDSLPSLDQLWLQLGDVDEESGS